ncbi:protein of unknown function DUF1847 [Syntrophotalea carbinolica DSM 2380]|uniref:Metal-binding protein n=1 Tax=Syntrophotalea carbinolica (strain DSM 2380 / NBRC 103641 / GraBd1) TaxID=338963 RepID=Q3A019_SYNC1|nr:DUF1847 domain-containing protein [Syntrophotalea carbinolica]ABA90288.1 protein of unknown function DUF1847 [Syntrophotalea carbinolica DSM 2380]
MTDKDPRCASCPYEASDRICRDKNGKAPVFCPTLNMPDLAQESLKQYNDDPAVSNFAKQASIQEADGYINRELGHAAVRGSKTRMEEIMEFAAKMGYKRLGLAFCMGLRKEAQVVEKLLSSRGFEVVSAICKVGGISKECIGLSKEQQVDPKGTEVMCNPIMQAMILNEGKTDFNVLLGLCVGHDSLFLKYAEAPCTVLAVKDRVLGHNPLAAIYNVDSYYRSLK